MDEELECLDGPEGCEGNIEYRMALSGSGIAFTRCDKHWDLRLIEQERIERLYAPNSDIAPEGFDPP